ncbi:MAG: SinI family restriction endonuclease [Cyanobacteria bacterium J06607_15]
MKFNLAIETLSREQAIDIAKSVAQQNNLKWNVGIETIFTACCKNPDLAPKIGGKQDDREQAIAKWILKYWKGYKNRMSQRISNPPGTVADPIIETIISTRLPNLSSTQLIEIIDGHRLSMSAENILGSLLEEYLMENLLDYGWFFAWGETLNKVDFCHQNGSLLQIKNRSNSENSSSNKVRAGTAIEKWYRVDARTGKYKWQDLNNQYSTNKFSEASFRDFVVQCLSKNPAALAVEANNVWLDRREL